MFSTNVLLRLVHKTGELLDKQMTKEQREMTGGVKKEVGDETANVD